MKILDNLLRLNNFLHQVALYFCDTKKLIISMLLLLIPILVHYLINNYNNIPLDLDKCPFCYGNSFCASFDNNEINFSNLTLWEQLSNLINIKNVYVATYKKISKVILKKLAHDWELLKIDRKICNEHQIFNNCPPFREHFRGDFTVQITEFLIAEKLNNPKNLKLCSLSAVNQFINVIFSLHSHLNTSFMTANIWTTLLANAEPLLLQILDEKNGWPVPHFYGACGRVIIEEYSGKTLFYAAEEPWKTRALIALNLMQAAHNFTFKHPVFRFYLTDISSDNIAVTENHRVKFIDLENVIIAEKNPHPEDSRPHESSNFQDCENCYAFSPDEICGHSLSDHNFYSICKLLLSKTAPWPMTTGGLLHSPPAYVVDNYPEVFTYVETCAESSKTMNRFEAAKRLVKTLQLIVEDGNFHL